MKTRIALFTLLIGLVLIVSGCKPVAICTPAELVNPTTVSPGWWEIVDDLTPTFTWVQTGGLYTLPYAYSYAYSASESCIPENYLLTLKEGPLFAEDLGTTTADGTVNSWVPTTPLKPGRTYTWDVHAIIGDTMTNAQHAIPSVVFYTGPYCEFGDMAAPVLLEPADGAEIDYYPGFVWDNIQGCLQPSYRFYLSSTPDFSDTSLNAVAPSPSTTFHLALNSGFPVDCTTYYWKVAAFDNTPASPGEGLEGPASEVFTFSVDMNGTCNTLQVSTAEPVFTAANNLACRIGPTLDHGILAYLESGQSRPAVARNQDGSWLQLRMNADLFCWAARTNGNLDGDPLTLPLGDWPIAEFQVTDTPGVRCEQYDQKACEGVMAASCRWVASPVGVNAGGKCVNR